MRLLAYLRNAQRRIGLVEADMILDLSDLSELVDAVPLDLDLIDIIRRGPAETERLHDLVERWRANEQRENVTFPFAEDCILAPLDPPTGNVLAIGRNYADHARETSRARGTNVEPPTVFTKAQTSINSPYGQIEIDHSITSQVDWEAELGVVIGKPARDVRAEDALEHVFGYTVVNDVSARDVQYGWGGQFFKGKSLDGFCPVGPWIVTAAEITDPQQLQITLRVNGVTKQSAQTRDMIYSVAEVIAWLSAGMTLLPGTLIATGTPSGVGHAREPKEFLRPGDIMEAEVSGIGIIRNKIVARSAALVQGPHTPGG